MVFLKDVEAAIGLITPAKSKLDLYRHAIVQTILNAGVGCVAAYRLSNWLYYKGLVLPSKLVDRFIEFFFGAQLCGQSKIGPGFRLFHPSGLVVSPETNAGKNVILMGGASMGVRDLHSSPYDQSPQLGDNVTIAIGAKILGPVTIGDGATVAANAVVMIDVPAGCIAAGIPAKIIQPKAKQPKADSTAPAAPTADAANREPS